MSFVTAQGLATKKMSADQVTRLSGRVLELLENKPLKMRSIIQALASSQAQEEHVRAAVWRLLDLEQIALTEDRSFELRDR